jgi:hypothetical protein
MNIVDPALPSPMSGLPEELVEAIVEQLTVRRGPLVDPKQENHRQYENHVITSSLRALTLTCRTFNRIATPILYRCITFRIRPVRRTRLLLRTLLSQQALSQHVEYIENPPRGSVHREDVNECFTASERSSFVQYLTQATWAATRPALLLSALNDGPRLDRMHPYMQQGRNMIYAAITLFALAGNLSEVVIPRSLLWKSVLACKRYLRSNGLRTLWVSKDPPEPLHLSQYDAQTSASSNPISDFLRREVEHDREHPNPLPELKHISLDVKEMHEDTLSGILGQCSALERFTCRWRGYELITRDPDESEEPDVVDLSMFPRVLRRFKDSLTSLTIDTMESICQIDIDEDIPAIGSLREFTSLQHLDVSGLVLWGDCDDLELPRLSGVLPESLETLIIKTEWDDDVEDALYNLCEDAFAVPRLRDLTCNWGSRPRTRAEALITAFKNISVELVLSIDKLQDVVVC